MGKILSSIRHRILFAFFVLAFVGAVSSLWNIHLLSGYEQKLEQLSSESIPSLIAAYEVARQGEAISKGASGVVLTEDKWTRDAFVDRITDQFNWLDNQLKVLADNGVDPVQLKRIETSKHELQQSFRELAKAVDERNTLVNATGPADAGAQALDPNDEIDRLLLQHKDHSDHLTYSVAELSNAMTHDIEASVGSMLSQIRVESWQLNVYTVAVIAFAILVTIIFDLKISSRVVGIQKSMRAVADGNTREIIPSGGSDEISDMADALSTFVEKLSDREDELKSLVDDRTAELMSAKDYLEISGQRLRNLLEVASNWFWETDADLNILYMSHEYFKVRGIDPPIGQSFFEHMSEAGINADMTELSELFEKVRDHQAFRHFEFSVSLPDGHVKYIQSSGIPVFDQGGVFEGYRGAMTDISEYKRAEVELRHAQKMQALGNLAGGVAHSFNNIFQPILILSELTMSELPEDSHLRERLQIAIEACRRGKSLGDRILLYSRQDEPTKVPINICDLVRATLDLFNSTAPSSILLIDELQEGVGEVVGDAAQIEALILNLASNAVDAIGGAKGEIRINLNQVGRNDIAFDTGCDISHDYYAQVTVSDTGCGMDGETKDNIFDPFFTTKGLGKGTGLGLSMASGIATMHGGGIKVTSTLGKGSTFDVFFPIMRPGRKNGGITVNKLSKGKEYA